MKGKQIDVSLVLLNGQEIEFSVPEDIWEQNIWPEIKNNFASQGLWNCGNWNQLDVIFMDIKLDDIDFHKILGIRY